jgi:signal transduction histidine kinase
LKELLSKIIHLGCTESSAPFDQLRVRTLNIGILTAIAIASATTVADVAFGRLERMPGSLIFFALAALVLKLQHAHKHSAAVFLMSMSCMALVWGQFMSLGPGLGLHLWLIALIIFPIMSMPTKDTKLAITLGVGHILALTYLAIQDQQEHGYSTEYLTTLVLSACLVMTMSAGMRLFLNKVEMATHQANTRDMNQIQELEEYQTKRESVLTAEREVSRLKEEFLASLSHELRTPLNAIMGLSEALNEEVYGTLTEKQSESLHTIWGSGQNLLTLINDMLDFARIGAGKYPTLLGLTDIRSSILGAAHACESLAEESEIDVILDTGDQPAMATLDGRHIMRVLKILLNNGIKFTPAGGTVSARVVLNETSGHITIEVEDTGIGIRPEKLSTLFDPFSQLDGGLSRQFEGAGLGLALCARLCRLMSASIDVESILGKGTTFTLRVPTTAPMWIEVFSDLRCPFCYILDEWLDEANMAHLVRWRGVEQMPGLSPEDGASDRIQKRLTQILGQLSQQYPDRVLTKPKQVSNTQRGLASLVRIAATEPERQTEARSLLYRAIWVDGKDITDWVTIRNILSGFELDGLDDDSPEMNTVVTTTLEWRERGEDRIPAAFALRSDESWHGLGQKADLIAFVEKELGTIATETSP